MKNKENEKAITKIDSKENLSLFSDKRKPIINAYSGIEGTRRYLKKSNSLKSIYRNCVWCYNYINF